MDNIGPSHWQRVYAEKASSEVSWFQSVPTLSLEALERFGAAPGSSVIDIGGGTSTLVDALVDSGWEDITVLDIAPSALDQTRAWLGSVADRIDWVVADMTDWVPARVYDVWHDRAVFHFLVQPDQRAAYRQALLRGLAPNGLVLIATFAPDGPEKCSGLPIIRYDSEKLAAEMPASFELLETWRETHITPWGTSQAFCWCAFRGPAQ